MRLHHVVWAVEPDTMDAAKDVWHNRLGTEMLDFPIDHLGLRILISWQAGVELITPFENLRDYEAGAIAHQVRDFLDARGEGVFSVVFEVDDLEQAVAQVESAGGMVQFREDIMFGEGDDQLHILQAMFDDIQGMRLTFQTATPVDRDS